MQSREFAAAVQGIIGRSTFTGARFGLDVHDIELGHPIFQQNANDIFSGASTAKIPTAVYALALLGPDYRFRTKLVRSGEVDKSGTLNGDLILVAAGDPNLSGRVTLNDTLDFENLDHCYAGPNARLIPRDPLQVIHRFAQAVREAGIRRVTGSVLMDVDLFDENYREMGTGTTVSPISINDNQIDLEVTAGAKKGQALNVRLSPQSSYVRFINGATTGEAGSAPMLQFSKEERQSDGSFSVTITGTVPPGTTSMAAFPVESPSRFARTLLVEALAAAGVIVEGSLLGAAKSFKPTPKDAPVIHEHLSAPLREVTKVILKVSQNLHAEMLIPVIGATLRGVTGEEARNAGYACGAELLAQWGVDSSGFFQGDACGAYGHCSPDFMSRLLVRIAATEFYQPFLAGLAIMGKDGTLWDIERQSPAAGHVSAKTGTLSLQDPLHRTTLYTCKGLAGYVTAKSGRHLAFTIYLNNFLCSSSSEFNPGQALGELASAIYEHL